MYLDVLEAVHTGDTVSDGEDAAGLLHVGDGGGPEDPVLQDAGDLGRRGLVLGILKMYLLVKFCSFKCPSVASYALLLGE